MLSPKWLARCTVPIAELYAQAESSILDDMARRISTYDFYIPAAQYQEEKLAMMGVTRQQIIAELSKRTGKTRQEIEKIMEAGVRETRSSDGAIYEQAGKTVPEKISPQMRKIIRSGLKQTAGLFENLTKTTAQTATRQFEKALDLAWLQVSTGAMDPQSATRQAIKSLCKTGIQAVAYSTGRSETLEVAVTRALRTGVNQTALKMQEQLADEMGSDLVEVTAHAGARPDHAKWQGKVYSLTGRTPGYQTLAKGTGYGTGAGLGGWNCRHSFFPHFPGQSNTYSKDELEEYTRPDAVEYNGKKMSLYEAEQTQRSIERQIRRWKREDNALEAAGLDTTESSAKVKLWNSRYKDFCAKTGLKQQRQRTVVYAHLAKKDVATAGRGGIIKRNRAMSKLNSDGTVSNPMDTTQYQRMKAELERQGYSVVAAKGDDARFLMLFGAEAISDEVGILHMGDIPSASAFFEEVIHYAQFKKYGAMTETDEIERAAREVAANRKLIKNAEAYRFTPEDRSDIERNLQVWEKRFERMRGVSYDQAGIGREI